MAGSIADKQYYTGTQSIVSGSNICTQGKRQREEVNGGNESGQEPVDSGMKRKRLANQRHRNAMFTLRERELSGTMRRVSEARLLDMVARTSNQQLHECELPHIERCNKIFSSVWINHDQVLAGTKDNKLVLWDIPRTSSCGIPLPYCQGASMNTSTVGGIYSIALHPSKTHFATSGRSSKDLVIFNAKSLQPTAILQGHTDWIFSTAWLDFQHIVTAARDKTVRLWRSSREQGSGSRSACLQVGTIHNDKVRSLAVDSARQCFSTVSVDGHVQFWNAEQFLPTTKVELQGSKEFVCTSVEDVSGAVAVGSQKHISLVDSRVGHVVHEIESLDEGCGVRTISAEHQVLTIGGGLGRLAFYDIRAARYLSCGMNQGSTDFITVGEGWLKRDNIYQEFFQNHIMQQAVYTVAYDPSRTKLFAGGGPRYSGLTGSYAAVW